VKKEELWRLSNSWVNGIYQDRRPMGWGCGQWLRSLVIQSFNSLINACTEHEKTALGFLVARYYIFAQLKNSLAR
jgi:hypothetical protein